MKCVVRWDSGSTNWEKQSQGPSAPAILFNSSQPQNKLSFSLVAGVASKLATFHFDVFLCMYKSMQKILMTLALSVPVAPASWRFPYWQQIVGKNKHRSETQRDSFDLTWLKRNRRARTVNSQTKTYLGKYHTAQKRKEVLWGRWSRVTESSIACRNQTNMIKYAGN